MSYEPLHHKYRPQTFAELVGQEAIATTLTNALRQQRIAPAYLFTGARGTGKTSSARILAKSLNCIQGDVPTAKPCGVCEVCRAIANGSALDVIEIDAASNTGVDNIRELIERSQFAPVQCRYKVYVIDECLTGDSLVLTSDGLVRIDDPRIQEKKVLSYNDVSGEWEFKKVVRWLDQGERETLVIKTTHQEIRCTGNHLIRTDQGWTPAAKLQPGMRILAPIAHEIFVEASIAVGNRQAGNRGLWSTTSENIESIVVGEFERVYDIEVEDNHNFVANGLLVHNCHMLSTAAFNALLKTLEEPPDRVVFVLATTDPQRVLATIISRCQRFDFRRISLEAMVQHLRMIADKEAIDISDEAITLVAQIAQGGLRDAESLLDQLSLLEGQVTVERVWDLVGAVPERDLLTLLQAIAQDHPEAVLDQVRHLMNRGREPLIVLQNLASFYRDLLIAKTASDRSDLVAITSSTWVQLCEFAQTLDISTILLGQQHLRTSEAQIKNTTQPRLWLEVTLLGLLPSAISAQTSITSQPAQGSRSVAHSLPQASPVSDRPPASSQPAAPTPGQVAPAIAPAQVPTPTHTPSADPAQFVAQAVPPTEASREVAPPTALTESNGSEGVAAPVAPVAEPPQTPTPDTPPPANPQNDLNQIWQQIILNLHPPATQALLKQQCCLLSFNGREARIGAKSQPLFKIVQGRVANIEEAFLKALNCKVKVSLEIAAPPEPVAPEQSQSSAPAPTTNPGPTPPTPDRGPEYSTGATFNSAPPPELQTAPPQVTETSWTATPPQQPTYPQPTYPQPTYPQPSEPAPTVVSALPQAPDLPPSPQYWQDEDEVTKAAKRLAEFFGGKVVDLEDSLESFAGQASSKAAANLNWESEVEADDDVPF